MSGSEKYVFVVCGSREYLDQLRFSAALLRRFSRLGILVVTDTRKNEAAVGDGLELIDVETPPELDPGRTAIYLKTGLHRWLPGGVRYCYLDTDVVAIRPGIDRIFEQYHPPVTFCTDHCRLPTFSPSAVHDAFFDHQQEKQQRLITLEEAFRREEDAQLRAAGHHYQEVLSLRAEFNRNRPVHARTISQSLALRAILATLAGKAVFQLMRLATRLAPGGEHQRRELLERWHRRVFGTFFSYRYFLQQHGYRYEPDTKRWYDLAGRFIYEEDFLIRRLEEATGYHWDPVRSIWYDEQGEKITELDSDLLRQRIREQFGVHITEPDWQHWNGGVFLFGDESAGFLENWHRWSREIFFHPQWKPRDQGTLAATAWRFGLEHHPTLPLEYNLIADFYHPRLRYLGEFRFALGNRQPAIHPFFVHIYHQWGNRSWALWQDVERLHLGSPVP